MVKTKKPANTKSQPVAKKPGPAAKENGSKTRPKQQEMERPSDGYYRSSGDWFEDVMSGETCRTSNFDKVVVILGRCRDEGIGFIMNGGVSQGEYFWYITRVMGETETKKPSVNKKGKKK